MTAQTDTFRAFIEVFATELDGPRRRGEELAASVHLSRYHFDRLIAAAAGEPPGRFRRRILLERAAYRLASAGPSVLEVALEAGYGSQEGFTRAFRRAFGRSPGQWRAAPGPFRLPSPNGAHFYPPGGLRLQVSTRMSSMDLVIRMVEHHISVVGEFIARARGLPETALDEPIVLSVEGVDDEPTLRSLLSRLVGQMDMWNASMAATQYDFDVEKAESLGSMAARLETAGQAFLATVRSACEAGTLDDTFVDAICEPPMVFTYGGVIAHVLTYAAHRRTLVAGALHSAGITDVAHDPLVYLAAPA